MKEKFLILGSNSFSGSNFINFILQKNYKTMGISRSNEIRNEFLIYKKNKNFNLFSFKKIDINKDINSLIKCIKEFKPKIIVNFIAQGMVAESWKNPEDWYLTNVVSQVKLYKKMSKFKFIKKFVHVSTPEVYGNTNKSIKENYNFNPSTPYAISRACMDTHLLKYFKNYKLPVIFTRTSNVYGPGQQLYRIIPKALICAKKKKKINLHGGGKSIRSFIYIDDASEATYLVAKKGQAGETYHISNKNFISIKQLVKKISKIEKIPFQKLCNIDKERIGKDHSYKLNSNKIIKNFKWFPRVNIDQGLAYTNAWINKNFKLFKKMKLYYQHKK